MKEQEVKSTLSDSRLSKVTLSWLAKEKSELRNGEDLIKGKTTETSKEKKKIKKNLYKSPLSDRKTEGKIVVNRC
jgi:hypothetical protein